MYKFARHYKIIKLTAAQCYQSKIWLNNNAPFKILYIVINIRINFLFSHFFYYFQSHLKNQKSPKKSYGNYIIILHQKSMIFINHLCIAFQCYRTYSNLKIGRSTFERNFLRPNISFVISF